MNETSTFEHQHCAHYSKRISWSAIVVGALVAVGLSFLLNLFGLAIGASAFAVTEDGAKTLAIGGVVAMFIGIIVSMTTAGYAAGYLGRFCAPRCNLGILYGFSTWTLALLLAVVIASPMAHYASQYSQTVSGSAISMPFDVDHGAVNQEREGDRPLDRDVVPAAKILASGAFLLFALFFVGGLFSCIGACWAMSCRKENDVCTV